MESTGIVQSGDNETVVDPFLVEALQNPRHRLTILRMELDIQRFLRNPDQLQFQFQHFPTSYLRLAAHRVAQHYGMQTMVQENGLDGLGSKILVMRTPGSKFPAVCLTDIPVKQSENDNKSENVKIAIRRRPNRASGSDSDDGEIKRGFLRSVEERKEEYDKARARIFSSPSSPQADDALPQASAGETNICISRYENETCRNISIDPEQTFSTRDGSASSRVAILRDREKERTDPDYDRSYERYVRSIPPNQSFNFMPLSVQRFPYVQYETGFSQLGHIPGIQPNISYRPLSNPAFSSSGLPHVSTDAAYMQWANPTMMYAHSYDQIRQGLFQAPMNQQPLSFGYSQNR